MNPSASSFSPEGGGYSGGYYEGSPYGDQAYGGEYYSDYEAASTPSAEPGTYYKLPDLEPSALPISAISYDSAHDAIYTTTTTTTTTSRKRDRASMMHVLSENGIYSSVFNHPEAPSRVLNTVYDAMYGRLDNDSKSSKAPPHAYEPVYGKNDPALPDTIGTNPQLGTTKLVNFQQGHVASVSPAGVRLHTMGGLQLADQHTEGMLSIAPNTDAQSVTHLIAGGTRTGKPQLHNLDLWQGLRIASSHALDSHIVVTCMEYSPNRHCVVSGGTDGNLHLVDNRVRRTIHTIKSHAGGVVDIAVSGTLVATTGYGSIKKSRTRTNPFAFPDPNILINDLRYMGRGGFPHSFAGLRGGPRFVNFLPDFQDTTRLLVSSGNTGGGCQIVVPFEEAKSTQFLIPQMDRGEAINAVCATEDKLAMGTTKGKVLQYKMAGYSVTRKTQQGVFVPSSTAEIPKKKEPLSMPPFQPPVPSVSLDARILLKDETKGDESLFGSFILATEPRVSVVSDLQQSSFGNLLSSPLVDQSKFEVAREFLQNAVHTIDFVQTIPTSTLEIDVLDDHRPKRQQSRSKSGIQANPNKLVYTNKIFNLVYKESFNRSKRYGKQARRRNKMDAEDSDDDGDLIAVPKRYRLTLRPSHKLSASFNYGEYNHTGLFPGFDHPTTKQNAFVAPVLSLLFFLPEIKDASLKFQLGKNNCSPRENSLVAELGCLFHRIEGISKRALLFPAEEGVSSMTNLHAWAPSSLISYLASMKEAERFQVLDGSPAAVDSPRRPEAFYRFLMYHLDNNIGGLDSLGGMDFVSINEFISGSSPPSESTTRHLTVELAYDYFFGPDFNSETKPCFGDVLQRNLSKETRLRAWNGASKSYETIVQRKIATSLPSILSLSANCAGRKEDEGLALWRGEESSNGHWLPEMIEVEIEEDGSVVVREQILDESGSKKWKECLGTGSLPDAISTMVVEHTKSGLARRRLYRLDAVVSLIRDDIDRACPEEVRASDVPVGHHVLHVRVTKDTNKRILQQQKVELKRYLAAESKRDVTDMTVLGLRTTNDTLQKRGEYVNERLKALEQNDAPGNDWILVNGFAVSKTFIEDAQAFHVKFKEPSLVVFRVVDYDDSIKPSIRKPKILENLDVRVPNESIRTTSITNGARSPYYANQNPKSLPGQGELVAFDAEFVAVEEEDAILTNSGSKFVISETRHALARISVLDGRKESAGSVIIDDHIVPTEPVTDYLTRFSGIVAQDLDPKSSRHHLIRAREAYLKLRCLLERGCIFVGHGLNQDFWTANLDVSPSQIIDTVEIYHKPAQRYISLRFLTNFVLKRDMQQDVHDSIEDALAAYELYRKAVELKKEEGRFEKLLDNLYEYGQKADWKLGMDDVKLSPK